MTRMNKKALFKLSPIACALALSFAFGAAPAVHAYETIPIVSDTGVPYIHFNILKPGELHSVYDDFVFYDPVDRELMPDELTGLELGTDYFWQLLRDSYAAHGPINILLMPYAVRDDNASAMSPSNPDTLMTDLGSAWRGLSTDPSKTAAYITVDSAVFNWYMDELPVLPHQAKDTDLPGTILHELFHAFGLTSSYSAVELNGEDWIAFAPSDTNLYTLNLHDLTGRSMAEIMEQSGKDTILLNVVTPGSNETLPEDAFNIYFNDRDSGVYFSGEHVKEVLNNAEIAWPVDIPNVWNPEDLVEAARDPVPGLPINGLEGDGRYFDMSHIELQNSLMSHQYYRNWCVLMEAEIALLQDIGYDIDRRRFYGYSIYNNNLTFNNSNPYWARKDDGSGWIVGEPSQQEWGIGLHIYGSNNKVTQIVPLMSDGKWGIGTRVDGVGNDLTIASGTVVQANGAGGKGILFSWGKNHNLTIEEGATVRAMGENGIGVSFDFGSNEMGDYWGYLGSYTALYQEHLMDVPEALRGPLVKDFTINGKVEGKLASIYISPNALVENIIVAPGAEIKGDIISLWDPYETIYGKRHLYYGEDPRGTTLLFGTTDDPYSDSEAAKLSAKNAGSKIVFNDNIIGPESIILSINDVSLVMTGTADVLMAGVSPTGELQGGHFRLHSDWPLFLNEGSLVSTQTNPVVIEGDYWHHGDKASLTLSVQDGKVIPLSVSSIFEMPDTVTVHGSPEGTWQASGTVKAPASSAVVTTQGDPVAVDFSWRDPSEYVASPTMSFTQTADGTLIAKRAPQAYSSRMTGESKAIGKIFDQSAEHLTTDSSKALFAAMDWSDMSGKTIAEAGRALMGDGLVDGTAAALQFERAAQMALDPSLPFTEPEGDYAWVKPVGGTSKVRSIGTVRTDIAGLAGGMIRKDADGEAGLSVAALTARGDASTIDDYNAKGIWVEAYRRAENIFDTPLFAKASVRLGYINSDEDRIVHYAGMTDKTEADVDRWSLGLSAHTGRAFELADTVRIEPYAGFEGFVHYVPSYDEDADGAAAMHAGSALYRSLEAQVGVKLEGAVFEPNHAFWQVHAAYGRELMPDAGDMKLSFAASDLRGNFKRAVDFDSKNRLRAGAKVGLQNKEGFTLNARLDYERESSSSAILAGGIEAQWRF